MGYLVVPNHPNMCMNATYCAYPSGGTHLCGDPPWVPFDPTSPFCDQFILTTRPELLVTPEGLPNETFLGQAEVRAKNPNANHGIFGLRDVETVMKQYQNSWRWMSDAGKLMLLGRLNDASAYRADREPPIPAITGMSVTRFLGRVGEIQTAKPLDAAQGLGTLPPKPLHTRGVGCPVVFESHERWSGALPASLQDITLGYMRLGPGAADTAAGAALLFLTDRDQGGDIGSVFLGFGHTYSASGTDQTLAGLSAVNETLGAMVFHAGDSLRGINYSNTSWPSDLRKILNGEGCIATITGEGWSIEVRRHPDYKAHLSGMNDLLRFPHPAHFNWMWQTGFTAVAATLVAGGVWLTQRLSKWYSSVPTTRDSQN